MKPAGISHKLAERIMSARAPDQIISHGGRPLFERWWLVRTPSESRAKTGNVYLHRFVRDDREVPHDHPWLNETTVLAGRLVEELFCPVRIKLGKSIMRELAVGGYAMREPEAIHRIIEVEPGTITLFETRRKVREWGFWLDGRFVPWRQYNDAPAAGAGE